MREGWVWDMHRGMGLFEVNRAIKDIKVYWQRTRRGLESKV